MVLWAAAQEQHSLAGCCTLAERVPCTLHGAPSSSRATPGRKSFEEMVAARMHRCPCALDGCAQGSHDAHDTSTHSWTYTI
jgi:hypothetical protein